MHTNKGGENMNIETKEDEQMSLFNDDLYQEVESHVDTQTNDELKETIEETISSIQNQYMFLGAKAVCQIILDKIIIFERQPGSKSNNDRKRLIKDIKNFVEVGLSRMVDANDKTESIEGTVQN
jgi:hypothetical protein